MGLYQEFVLYAWVGAASRDNVILALLVLYAAAEERFQSNVRPAGGRRCTFS